MVVNWFLILLEVEVRAALKDHQTDARLASLREDPKCLNTCLDTEGREQLDAFLQQRTVVVLHNFTLVPRAGQKHR